MIKLNAYEFGHGFITIVINKPLSAYGFKVL